ncbi:hypothetical protein QF034_008121 [Streptomyces africanus]|uniref:Uncharacterized protein n=1 Tax=Streptomyces africanus TaxID=231024 RepID=A0ABU0R2K3_9ACTN|nr:hypothetical protein [Streptomyces africanus]
MVVNEGKRCTDRPGDFVPAQNGEQDRRCQAAVVRFSFAGPWEPNRGVWAQKLSEQPEREPRCEHTIADHLAR